MTPRWLYSLAALAACAPHHHAPTTAAVSAPGRPMTVNVDPKLVELEVTPTTTLVTAAAASDIGLRVHITAKALPEENRPPLDVALVLDTSGSMKGDAIKAVIANAHTLVDKMRDGDVISVIAFHSKVDVLAAPTKVDSATKQRIHHAIDGIQAHGTTDLADGLAEAYREIATTNMPTAIRRVVLLSDGVPNDSAQLPQLIANLHAAGIPVTTLGLGVDYDDTVMIRIANETGGSFHYIDKPDELADVFKEELAKMSTVVAQNMSITLTPGPGVQFRPMPGLAPMADGRVSAFLGDLSAGESRDLMLPVALVSRGDGAIVEITDATLTYADTIGHSGANHREAYAQVEASSDKQKVKDAVVVALEVTRVRTVAAGAILEAITMARNGQIAPARQHLAQASQQVKEAMTRLKDDSLKDVLAELDEVSKGVAQMVVPQQAVLPDPSSNAMVKPSSVEPQAPAVAPMEVERTIRAKQDHAVRKVNGRK